MEVTNSDCYLLGSVHMWTCKIGNNISEVGAGGFSAMFLSDRDIFITSNKAVFLIVTPLRASSILPFLT
jgi:hypothetical protein